MNPTLSQRPCIARGQCRLRGTSLIVNPPIDVRALTCQGIEQETAKKMVKDLKGSKLKVQAQIQGDELRVTGKSRDLLQEAIAFLKREDYGLDLQFTNFRE